MKKILGPDLADRIDIVDLSDGSQDKPVDSSNCIGVGSNLEPKSVLQKATDLELPRIVQEDSLEPELEIHSSANLIVSGDDFINHPISAILDSKNVCAAREQELRKFAYQFSRSDEKVDLITKLERYLQGVVGRDSLCGEILAVTDELFTNAIYNAPYVADENDFKGANRGAPLIQSDKKANFYAGDNGTRIALAAIDRYGSLDLNRLLKRVRNTYEEGAGKTIDLTGTGGAGLGTFMMFETCSSMYLIVRPGEYTIVAVTIPLGLSRREQKQVPKNLHCLEI